MDVSTLYYFSFQSCVNEHGGIIKSEAVMMEDAVSRSSLDSSSTGDEYVLVNADPKLRITGDINDLNTEIGSDPLKSRQGKMTDSMVDKEIGSVIPSSQSVDVLNTNGSATDGL